MKKLIILDDDFYMELKKAFLPDSLRFNDMAFIRHVLQFAKEKADESRAHELASKKKNHRSP